MRPPPGIVVLLLLGAAGCGGPGGRDAPGERIPIELGVRPFLTNAPIYIADDEGFFDDAGLDVRFRTIPTAAAPYLTTLEHGELDILAAGPSIGLFNTLARGARLRIVSEKGHLAPGRCSPSGIVVREGTVPAARTGDAGALRGRTIDVNPTTPRGYYLETFLHRAGLTLADIEPRTFPTAARPEALRTGAVDASATSEPWITRLLDDGHQLFAPANDIIPGFPMGLLIFGPRLLGEDRDVGERFLAAYFRGVDQYNQGKTARNLEILSRRVGLDEETLRRVCWPSVGAAGTVDTTALRGFQEWAEGRGVLDRVLGSEAYLDAEPARAARRTLDSR